jgi:hypothetical protein
MHDIGIGFFEDAERDFNNGSIRSFGDAGPFDIKRNGPDPFMRVGLETTTFKDSDGAEAYVVVEFANGSGNNTVHFIPWSPLLEDRFHGSPDEKTIEKGFGFLVEEKVAMKIEIGGEELQPDELKDFGGLIGLLESGIFGTEFQESILKPLLDTEPGGHTGVGAPPDCATVESVEAIECFWIGST